ncbi:MAG: hypothetical protein E6Q59_00980 [Nitrosomonas sp.]|nr:MAG: hypothetical protein E6Q59_00980 [Nitrosomonas sp.]
MTPYNDLPRWARAASDAGKIARLAARYQLLRRLIVELRSTMAGGVAPPAEVYLEALDFETRYKSLDEMVLFVDGQLLEALSNLDSDHPVQRGIKEGYRRGVEAILPAIVSKISSGASFDEIMAFMAEERKVLAETVADMPSHQFGLPRIDPGPRIGRTLYTSGGRFGAYKEAILALVTHDERSFTLTESFKQSIGVEGVAELRGRNTWAFIDGREIPISTLLVCDELPSNPKMRWLFSDSDAKEIEYPVATLMHTDTEYIPAVWGRCVRLYDQVQSFNSDVEQLIELIASLQWYLAHAMLYCRGSAAMAEWLCWALFKVKKYDVTWMAQPDLEALMRPNIRDFITSYSSFSKLKGVYG